MRRRLSVSEWYRLGWLLPWLVLLVSLIVTYLVWQNEQQSAIRDLQLDFDFRVRETHARMEDRLKAYEQILRGARALFIASKSVNPQKFRAYIESLHLDDNYPGSHGVGFIDVVSQARKAEHERERRSVGFSNYEISPEGHREVYAPVALIEPFVGNNRNVIGYDFYIDSIRRTAMELARDTNMATNSGRVILPPEEHEDEGDISGFLMFQPLYKQGAPIATVEERRANISGWVYVPFHMMDLMTGILGEVATEIDIEIHDGVEITDETMMFDPDISGAGGNPFAIFKNISRLEVGQHVWSVVIVSLPGFEARLDHSKSNWTAYLGVMMSLMATILAWSLVQGRARALQAAEAINHELTERKAAEKRIQYLAHHDVLTGLPNRMLFSDRLQQSLSLAKRDKNKLSLMFLDLDKFKPVNDNYGHAVGDLLLKEVAQRLQSCMRESDTVSRIGGDEFVVLLPAIEVEQDAVLVAEKILRSLNEPFELAGKVLHISASIGFVVYPDHGADEITLTKNADLAMYFAKASGRDNAKLFQPDMLDKGAHSDLT